LADYNKEQSKIIDENKKKISGISILSKPERIERIAVEELKMRKALSAEILRVSISKENKDGEYGQTPTEKKEVKNSYLLFS